MAAATCCSSGPPKTSTPEDTGEVNNHESGGTFRDALKEQLGLKLKPEEGSVQILVIDRIEQPSPN